MRLVVVLLLAAVISASCVARPTGGPPSASGPARSPERPDPCRVVKPAEDLGAVLAQTSAGAALCLEPGTWRGAWVVPPGVTLFGHRDSVLESDGVGSTVRLASGARLLGLTVDGSGGRFDVLDAAIRLKGEDIEVVGTRVQGSVFGILSEKVRRARIVGNEVVGIGGPAFGLRGDGIRLWETRDSLVADNFVKDARDCVVWYSSDNEIRNNVIRDGRYGVHFMYSHGNRVEENRLLANEVGIFLMYSRNLTVTRNEIASSRGPSGIGLGVKESGNLVVRENSIVDNTQGIFLDNSPLDAGDFNTFERNEIRLSDVGVGFLSSQKANRFERNVFRDNHRVVRVDGGGDALDVVWSGNSWSDYVGYDLDGNGEGDVPFELRDLSGTLESRYPALGFLRGTPALALVSLAGEVVPLLKPKAILRDEHPALSLPEISGAR